MPQRCDWKEDAWRLTVTIDHYFNTSKVRLEVVGSGSSVSALIVFQYLKGAIGRRCAAMRRRSGAPFNTSKVRLEDDPFVLPPRDVKLSIPQRCDWKAVSAPRAVELSFFQYLKGAIGSSRVPDGDSVWTAFNTSKVRLEEAHHRRWRPARLLSIPQRCDWKLPRDEHLDKKMRYFQYLKGAIGSVRRACVLEGRLAFNTSKVRLEAGIPYLYGVGVSNFNTSKVRLEAATGQSIGINRSDFNTSKVRLEVLLVSDVTSADVDFNTSKVRLEVPRLVAGKGPGAYFNTSKVRLEAVRFALR